MPIYGRVTMTSEPNQSGDEWPPFEGMLVNPSGRQELLWVLRAQSGDRQALERLLGGLLPALRRYLASIVGPADADDVAQEVMLQVYRKLGGLEVPEAFRAWWLRIASRAAFRHLRRTRRWRESLRDDDALASLPAREPPPAPDLLARLGTIDGVSAASRAVLALHFQEQLSLPAVAAVLAIPLGTVKSRLASGLASLRARLGLSEGSNHEG
jgi:RNA polymerase sigma-70 factor (ECF subfamily)